MIFEIKQCSLECESPIFNSSALSNSSLAFLKNMSEQLIVYYCALTESLASKSKVSSSQISEREEKDRLRMKDLEGLIETFFQISSHEIIN